MDRTERERLVNEQQTIIFDRMARLTATDYVAWKIAEGAATKNEYADVLALRRTWRADINAAETETDRLMGQDVDDEYKNEI